MSDRKCIFAPISICKFVSVLSRVSILLYCKLRLIIGKVENEKYNFENLILTSKMKCSILKNEEIVKKWKYDQFLVWIMQE